MGTLEKMRDHVESMRLDAADPINHLRGEVEASVCDDVLEFLDALAAEDADKLAAVKTEIEERVALADIRRAGRED